MDSNEYERIDGAQQVANGSVAHPDKAHLTQFRSRNSSVVFTKKLSGSGLKWSTYGSSSRL